MDTIEAQRQNSSKPPEQTVERPVVYSYVDYRIFLKDYCQYLTHRNPQFSETAFIRKAGYCNNSRGYLGLIIKGKRNLSNQAIIKFARACEMNDREASYFESLVYFNQAKNAEDRDFYFQRISKANKNKNSKAHQLLESQYRYCSCWYVVAIRELVSLDNFVEDPVWIAKHFNFKLTKKQITQAIEDLLALKLLDRDERGRLQQVEGLVRMVEGESNVQDFGNFHRQMMELSKQSLQWPYQERSASSVVLTCEAGDMVRIREEIRQFRANILSKYGAKEKGLKQVLAMNIQLFPLTL